ncbi:YqzH family protein [Metabacillus sp. FJAT-52054]|uniref:YqzH family protein n=1 Tax=Metabacillus sediminis TaxID=3117746 RepID=A0ABZ2NP70_9BACI
MQREWLEKMLNRAFRQYGRNLEEHPLPEKEMVSFMKDIEHIKDEETEYYEVMEDLVYEYMVNKDDCRF